MLYLGLRQVFRDMVDILNLDLFKDLAWMGLISFIPFGFLWKLLLFQYAYSIFLIDFDNLGSNFALVLLLCFK